MTTQPQAMKAEVHLGVCESCQTVEFVVDLESGHSVCARCL